MPRVFRASYTQAVPADAVPVKTRIKRRGRVVEVAAVQFRGPDGKRVVAPLTANGQRCRLTSPTWYGKVGGERVPLCSNKAAAEIMLGELLRKAQMEKASPSLANRFGPHLDRPLADHLGDYRSELTARENDPRYTDLVIGRLSSLFRGCDFHLPGDISASRAMDWLAKQRCGGPARDLPAGVEWFTRGEAAAALGMTPTAFRDAVKRLGLQAAGKGPARRFPRQSVRTVAELAGRGMSVQTANYYVSHLKSFCLWMVRDQRIPESPVAHLEALNADVDRRHARRELTPDELRRLLAVARESPRVVCGFTGEDRHCLYACAAGTGFRAGALASLTPGHFDLTGRTPTVALSARKNKSRRARTLPLPSELAGLLAQYLPGRPADVPLWGGDWAAKGEGAEMLRADLGDAGIPYMTTGQDGVPLYADFHSLRHSYITTLGRAGVDLRTAQELAGHSTPALTARYMHIHLRDLAASVEKLPGLLTPDSLPSHNAGAQENRADQISDPASPSACPLLVQTSDSRGGKETTADNSAGESPVGDAHSNPLSGCRLRLHDDSGGQEIGEAPPGFEPGVTDLQSARSVSQPPFPPTACDAGPGSLVLSLSLPPDLAQLVEVWPDLPPHVRAAILTLASAALPALPAGPEEPLDRPRRVDSPCLRGYSGGLTGGVGS